MSVFQNKRCLTYLFPNITYYFAHTKKNTRKSGTAKRAEEHGMHIDLKFCVVMCVDEMGPSSVSSLIEIGKGKIDVM